MKKAWRSIGSSLFLLKGILITFCALFSSCSIQNQRAEISSNPDLDLSFREAFLSKDFIPGEWGSEKWWELFNDPQLSAFIETALEKSPTLDAAQERIKLAHQTSKMQFAPLLPELDASVSDILAAFSYRRRGTEINEPILPNTILPHWLNLFDSLLRFKWNLDLWGKQRRLFQAAVDEMKKELAEAAYQKLILSIQVARTYFNLQYAMRVQDLKEQMRALLQEKYELLLAQREYGLATDMQIDTLSKDLSKFEMSLMDIDQEIAVDLSQLGVYLSLNPEQTGDVQMPQAEFNRPFPLPGSVSIDLLVRRPDVVAKIWAVQAATQKVNAAKVAFFPSIDLSSFSGYFTLTYKEIMKPRAWFTSILPGASLPLFHGLKLKSHLQYRLHEYNYAVYEYNEQIAQAAKEVVNSITSYRFCQDKIEEQAQVMALTYRDKILSDARFEYGLNTLLQIKDHDYALLEEQCVYAQLLQLRLVSVLNLVKAIGGGYQNTEAYQDLKQDFIYE